jgi:hypothetical protein
VTGLLPQPPRDPPPAPGRKLTRNQFALWCLLVAGVILLGSLAALWLLSRVWDPFNMRGLGVWEGYRRAFIWIAILTTAGEAIAVMVARSRRGEPPAATTLVETTGGFTPASPAPTDRAPDAPPPTAPAPEPERRTAAEWLADPPRPPESELETPREALRGLARFLSIACWVFAVALGLLGFTCAAQEPSMILGTDPQGAARSSFLMAGGLAIAAILLRWAGRDR